MADFTITAPDGKRYKVSGPTREGALAALRAKLEGNNQTPAQPTQVPTQTTQAAPQQAAPQEGNPDASVFGYARDNMQKLLYKGVESSGRLVGSDAIADFGTRGVERNEQQIEDANYQSDYQGSFLDQPGIINKAGWTWEKILENSGTAAVGVGGAAATATAAFFSAPLWVTLGIAGTAVGTSSLLGTGEVAGNIEDKIGTYDPKVAGSAGLIIGLLDRVGATTLIPKDQLLKMGSNEIVEILAEKGATGLATEFTKAVARKSGVEGLTEVAQDATSMGAEVFSGGEVTGREALNRSVDSFVLGTGTGATVTSALDSATMAGSLFKMDGSLADAKNFNEQQKGAIGDVARQLKQIAEAEGFNLKNTDVSAQMGAKGALEALRDANNAEITDTVKILKPLLNSKNAESFDSLINDFAPANAAIKSGKNKVSGYVTKSQMQALSRLVAPYQEGQALMNALAKSNTITGLFKDGMKGGISQFTDYFSPFGSSGAVYDPTRMGNIIIGGGMAGVTQGTSIPLQAGVVGLGRLVDAATGRRNRLSNFVNKNLYKDGLPTPKGESLIEQGKNAELKEAQLVEEGKARREAIAAVSEIENAPGSDKGPVGKILLGTGLDQEGLVEVINDMAKVHANQPDLIPVLDSITQNIEGGKNQIIDLTPLIPVIGQFAQNHRPELIVARPDNELLARTYNPPAQTEAQTQGPAQPQASQQSGNQFTSQENYQAGKEENVRIAGELAGQVMSDPNLSRPEQANLLVALSDLQSNLGPAPVQALTEITQKLQSQGVEQSAIDKHVMPYVDRVIKQQDRAARLAAPVDPESNMELDQDPMINLPSAPALQDVIPTGTNTNVPMETAVTRSSNMARSKVYAKGRDLKLDIQKASLKAQKANNVNLQEMTPENAVRLADFAVFDALEAIKTNQNAIGWYEGTIDQMVDNLSQVVPEIKTNQPNRLQFFWALAVTSNGLVVDKNLNLAVDVYEHLQKTGRFPVDMGIGTAAQGINEGLAKYHKMIDKFDGDHQALEDFMLKKMRSGDIEGIVGIKPTGEGENATVRGAAVLGAKIGNGFFSNLYGEYDALTMDRWLMRTVGRWRGNLVKKNKPMERKKRDELLDYLKGLDDTQLARLKKLYKGTGTKISNKTMSDAALDKLSVATAKLSMKPEWRDLINPEFKDVRLIGNGLAGYLDGQVEIPAGPSERQHIRDIFQKGLDDLNNNPEVRKLSNKPLTMADFQALLWYQEKLLYDTAKKPIGEQNKEYKDEEAPDYANAAQKLVTRRAIERDRLGSSGSTSRRGGGPSAANDVQRGQSVSKGALELDQDAPALARATNGGRSTNDLRQDGRSQEEGTQRLPALALQNTAREPQLVSSLNGLGSADTLNDFLARPGWAILTATQENLSPTIRDKRNQENNADLEKQLQDQNIPYLPVSGAYKGVDQGPSFLILTDEPAAMALGRKHLQESILTNNGLVYTKRTQPDTLSTQQNQFGPQAQQEDFYSTVSGLPFSMGLDFNTGPGNPVFKSGFVEAQNRPQLPVRDADGLVELHHWSSKQLKSIDPNKAGTGPYSGAERRRGAKLGFFGINPRQNLREQGTGYVKEPSLGGYEHIALVDPNDLYPIIEDPDGILANMGSDISDLEKAIKDAGYKGYYTTDDGSGKAPLGNVAALFDPIEVSEVRSKPQEELDQSIPALSNFLRNGAAKLRARIAPRPASQQVKSQAPVARALFEIGKKGSQFENGITNINDALKLAKALSITVNMFHDQQQMTKAAGYSENQPGIRGVFVKTPGGSSGEVFALEPGTETDRGPISDIDALTTVLHEIFHGVGAGPMSGSRMSGIALPVDVGKAMAKSPENAIRRMIKKPQGKRTNQERKIMHEIKRLQNQINVYAEANPKERRSVRLLTASMDTFAEKRGSMSPELQLEVEQNLSNYEQYIRKTSEFTVDPFWVYAFNPKLAKAVMPETTKWIRENLKAAGNTNIQFYSHPLAMAVAVVAAILAQQEAAEDEEEQQRQMMPPGALSPQMGALSAA